MNQEEQLVQRLNRFFQNAKSEISATPPTWEAPGQRRRRWIQPVFASAALAVVVLSVGLGVRMFRETRSQVHVTTSATTTATAAPSATPKASPAPSPGADWVTQRFPIGSVSAMVLDSSAVFALYAPSPTNGAADPALTKVARIDRSTGAVTTSSGVPNASTIARVGAGVWIAAGSRQPPAATDTQRLTLVDPITLAVLREHGLPGQTQSPYIGPQLAGNAQLLWLGYGAHLYRLDPNIGNPISTQNLPGSATSLSLDPSGKRLYVGIEILGDAPGSDRVLELDASTGATLASADTGGRSLGGPQVAAAADGVWISFATGSLGSYHHLSAANLATLPVTYQRFPNGNGTSNGIHVVVAAGALWLVDGMAQEVACADPGTGTIRASTQLMTSVPFVADSRAAYVTDFTGISALQPPAACRG